MNTGETRALLHIAGVAILRDDPSAIPAGTSIFAGLSFEQVRDEIASLRDKIPEEEGWQRKHFRNAEAIMMWLKAADELDGAYKAERDAQRERQMGVSEPLEYVRGKLTPYGFKEEK
jgi:hypothetical protein